MELDQAMLVLARTLAPETAEQPTAEGPDEQLTEAVRKALLEARAGRLPAHVAPADAAALQTWLAGQPADVLYQQTLSRVVVRDGAGILAVQHERRAHRATGAYYTGDIVVGYLLDRLTELLPGAQSLIDPACGAGAFLTAARGRCEMLVGLDADPLALSLCRERVSEAKLHVLDALLDPFPGGYDLCVGNPPYISSGLRGAPAITRERLTELRRRYPQTAEYKVNTYPLFIERGLELLRPGGVLGFILPDSFLSGRYFAGTRELLLRHTLRELTLIREDFWEHGHVGQAVLLIVQKAPLPPGHRVRIGVCGQVEDLQGTRWEDVPLNEVVWGPLRRFRLLPDPALRRFALHVEGLPGGLPLGRFLKTYSGLIARHGQSRLLRSENPAQSGPWGRLLRSGREIDRYTMSWAGEEVCLDPAHIKSGGCLEYYRNPKILLRQTADSLRGVYDEQGYFCLNNIHLLVPREGTGADLRLLLGLINSATVNRYYRALTMEAGRLYPQVDLDLLETIPVPPVSRDDSRTMVNLVLAREKAAPEEAALLDQEINRLCSRLYGVDPD